MMTRWMAATLLATGLACTTGAMAADAEPGFEDLVATSCAQAAALAKDDDQQVIDMVQRLTEFLVEKRNVTVPGNGNDDDLSAAYGELIKAHCRVDPHGLLINAVDSSMRQLLDN
ncbi:MAG: YmgD family protein [Geminicoccaceae bacterium]|nr:YmgD family protein [Geminicoccaceae bacterium]MCB9945707.1 YmgD family protein [Geminicoccaceae bacterium]